MFRVVCTSLILLCTSALTCGSVLAMDAIIQRQNNGMWVNVTTLPAQDSQKLLIEMRTVKRSYPNERVRAVDKDGRLIDILTD